MPAEIPVAFATGHWLAAAGPTFLLIALAEFGDKSQLVCMALATRHRGLPVLLGAVAAFALLNLLAVLFGGMLAVWIPRWTLTLVVAVLFATFGIKALAWRTEEDAGAPAERAGHSVFASTFLLIFLAELGDKTQIAVAGLGSTGEPLTTWMAATLALAFTSALGIFAGRRLMRRLPLARIQQASGVLFLALAAYALSQLF